MAFLEYAKDELERAGFFAQDSDYAGMVGPAVMEMMKQFAAEGHSGYSAHLCLSIFERLARFRPLTPIENPMDKTEFHDCSEMSGQPCFQSTRYSPLFSDDDGKRWYDIEKKVSRWKRWFGVRHSYVTFPYMP